MKQVSYFIEKCMKANVGVKAFNDLSVFLAELQEIDADASKRTHYDGLNEWSDLVYGLVHERLNKYGFINGGVELGKKQPIDAEFWFLIYCVLGNVCYSVNLVSKVSHHHSSAWERNQALIKDIQDIIKFKPKITIMV